MSPRVSEILDRLEAIDMEAMALHKELREVLGAKVYGSIEKHGNAEQADFSMFKETTSRLLTEFLNAPDHILSYGSRCSSGKP